MNNARETDEHCYDVAAIEAQSRGEIMLALFIILMLLWIVGGIAGLAVKGLIWLFFVSLVLFIITAIWGFVKGLFSKKN